MASNVHLHIDYLLKNAQLLQRILEDFLSFNSFGVPKHASTRELGPPKNSYMTVHHRSRLVVVEHLCGLHCGQTGDHCEVHTASLVPLLHAREAATITTNLSPCLLHPAMYLSENPGAEYAGAAEHGSGWTDQTWREIGSNNDSLPWNCKHHSQRRSLARVP